MKQVNKPVLVSRFRLCARRFLLRAIYAADGRNNFDSNGKKSNSGSQTNIRGEIG